jgi:drug/metabolite transporter (DMT)-like permease
LIGSALFWSGNFIVGRALRGEVPPISLNFWRWSVALMILFPLSYSQLRQYKTTLLAEWKIIAMLGLTGIAAFHICVYQALTSTTAINALLFLSTSPMVIVLGSWLFFSERITIGQGVGIIISLLGAVILIAHGDPLVVLNFHFNQGDIWMALAVPLWALYSILLKRRPARLPQIVLLTGSVMAGVAMMLPVYIGSLWMGQTLALNGANIMGVLYISIFASVLAFFFWNRGVAHIGPNRAGMFIHLMPLFGAILSVCFLGEGLAMFHLSGGLFVFTGIVLTSWQKMRPVAVMDLQ